MEARGGLHDAALVLGGAGLTAQASLRASGVDQAKPRVPPMTARKGICERSEHGWAVRPHAGQPTSHHRCVARRL